MKGKSPSKTCTSNINDVEKETNERNATSQLSGDVSFGDVIWTKLHNSLWWPAQVIDKSTVTERIRSGRSENEVLVRLYGTYEYVHVDPIKCRLEFDTILKESSGNYNEIFQQALEQVLSDSKPVRSKRNMKSEGVAMISDTQRKMSRKNCSREKKETDSPTPFQPRIFEETSSASSSPVQLKKKGSFARKSEEAKSRKRKQGVQNGDKPESPKPVTEAEGSKRKKDKMNTRSMASTSWRTSMKNGNPLSDHTGSVKTKRQKQDGLHEELSCRSSSSKRQKMAGNRNSVSGQGNMKKRSRNESLAHDKKKNSMPNDQKSLELSGRRRQREKPAEAANKQKHDGPESSSKPSAGKQPRVRNISSVSCKGKQVSENKPVDQNKKNHPKPKDQDSLERNGRQGTVKDADKTNEQKRKGTRLATPEETPQKPSARRIKVMQSLGLIAPIGSPFC